ncbi:MAG: DUF5702 domain-containing protein [Anaerovoracaceae bacterium]
MDKRIIRNEKGSSSVFLVFILAAMLSLTAAFVHIAWEMEVKSQGDGLLNLAGQSILSEFDLDLKEDYGLFGFYNGGAFLDYKIKNYVNYSLDGNDHGNLQNANVNVKEYLLTDSTVFKRELLEYMKFAIAKGIFEKSKSPAKEKPRKDRVLRNKKIINSLPSTKLGGGSTGLLAIVEKLKSNIELLKNFTENASKTYLIDKYIIENFSHELKQVPDRETFFTREVEYILEGNYSNKINGKKVKEGLVAFRTGLNLLFLYADPEKSAETMAAAQAITPGPEAAATQAAIAASWAYFEGKNDLKLLKNGKKVVLFKSGRTWALDINTVLKGTQGGFVDTGANEGYDYKGYLELFLHFKNENEKLARVMDLIQLNMKGNHNKDFLIQDYNCGFQLDAQINGRQHGHKYQY